METTTAPRTRTGARTPAATLALICTGGMRIGLVIAACAFLLGAAMVSGLAPEPG